MSVASHSASGHSAASDSAASHSAASDSEPKHPAPKTDPSVIDLDLRHVWHPYTSTDEHHAFPPLVVQRAQGPWLWDASGQRFFDAFSSWWVAVLGHQHPRLIGALKDQADNLAHVAMGGLTHAAGAQAAAALAEAAPGDLERVFFSDDGSTAVEVAAKVAYQYFQQNGQPERTRFITLGGAFHGDTVGAMSLGDIPEFHRLFAGLMFGVWRMTPGDDAAWVDGLIDYLRHHGHDVAGVVVEPLVQGASGMRFWSPAALRKVREATERAGIMLIADEVFTGFGRTGRMWACDHADVVPDILCTAKGLSGGLLPFAATLVRPWVFNGFQGDEDRALMHGHTFCGNPLGARVALEVLNTFRDERVLEGIPERESMLRDAFEGFAKRKLVSRPRVLGMVAACQIGADEGYRGELGWRVHRAALKRGVLMRPLGNTVYVTPPLNVSLGDLGWMLRQLGDALAAVEAQRA